MSTTAPTRRPAAKESRALEQSFAAFTRISRALEEAYDRLREQAARVDLELAESNRRLNEKVAELDATTRHLDAVVKSLAGAVVVTDPGGSITLVNRAFEELVGEPAAALVGRRKAALVDAEGRPICPSSNEGSNEGGDAGAASRPLALRNGRRIVRSSRAPVVGADGSALGEVEALADETEVEALREELRRRETLTALGEMAAGIAHELRNPLNAVEGFAHLLVKALDAGAEAPKDPRLHALRIVAGVRKANAIITNLLCFARPSRFAPRRARIDRLLLELRQVFSEEGGRAHVEIRPALPRDLEVAGDLALLERMLVNLIENGRTAAGAAGRVTVTARPLGGEVLLVVEDDGPGIPPELRDRLFRPFVTGRSDGIGLGLFLVHRIVELHRGRIDVAPRAGGGTVFTVRLPGTRNRERAQPLPAREESEGASR